MEQSVQALRSTQDLDRVRNFYCSRRAMEGAELSIYEIWERGAAFHDSVTPSTFSPEYRSHMVLKLISLTQENARVFSIGCGNGFVEADLQRCGRRVRAIDCNEEAVLLTAQKGVEAFTADFFGLSPASLAGTEAIYADGLLGHLFQPREELWHFLDKLRSLNLRRGTRLVFSNDAPRDGDAAFAPHDRVDDFWFLSKDYLREVLAAAGLETTESYYFPYIRPVSGMRNRTICIARMP